MKDETNKIVNWIEMGYTRLNYKEELLLVNYIKQLQQENKKYKETIDKIRKEINEEYSIMGVEVVENWVLKDILNEVK